MRRRRTILGVVVLLGSVTALAGASTGSPGSTVTAGTQIAPSAHCSAGDRPETGIQGQVPAADRLSGRAATGYSCNMTLVSTLASPSFANFDTYGHCAYFSDNEGGTGIANGTVAVVDLSNPAKPRMTDHLTAGAFRNPGESLRVNARRGLLVGAHYDALQVHPDAEKHIHDLAVYSVAKDCAHPTKLADVQLPNALGHEGCFQPDGRVYYMSSSDNGVTPIDLSDPRHPRELTKALAIPRPHGCSISPDGKIGYFSSTLGGVYILDTSQVQAHRKGANYTVLAHFPTPDNTVQQSSYPFVHRGRTYLYAFGESVALSPMASKCQGSGSSLWGYGQFIDVTNPRKPFEVSKLQMAVHDPANCNKQIADTNVEHQGVKKGDPFWAAVGSLLLYDFHHCSLDRLNEPTIVACASFGSGLRVFDIRDIRHPREIGYYNTGTVSRTDPTLDYAAARPVIRRDLKQIWWVTVFGGLHVAKFENGVWPFKGDSRCPVAGDYYARQYDQGYDACVAQRARSGRADTVATPLAGGDRPKASQVAKTDPRTLASTGVSTAAAVLGLLVLLAGFLAVRAPRPRR